MDVVQDPENVERVPGTCSFALCLVRACRGELQFAWEESEDLMLEFASKVPGWQQLSRADLQRHRCLRWNPLWWLCILGCAACIVLGHGFHATFCQGGSVRTDEYEVERRARIWWVYCYSGGFVGTVLVDIVALLSALASNGSQEERNRTIRSCQVAILIQLWYMIGDLNLLYRMSRKDTVLMHAAAISRVTFGAAFLVAFVIGLLTPAGQAAFHRWAEGQPEPPGPEAGHPPGPPPPRETAITWMIRLFFCLFMVVAYLGYTPLLRLDYSEAEPLAQSAAQRGLWKLKVALVAGVVVLAAEGFMFSRGPGLYMLAAQPFFVLGTAYLMEDGKLSCRRFVAALGALLPFVVVGSGFAICGPSLWEILAGRSHEEQAGCREVTRKDEDLGEREKTILRERSELFAQGLLSWPGEGISLLAQSAKREQELERKSLEIRERENELRKKEREVDSLRDQVRKLEDQVQQERRAAEDLQYKNQSLVQELHLRNRELQEQSEELAKFIQELDAQSRGNIPSVIKETRQAREEDPENVQLKAWSASIEGEACEVGAGAPEPAESWKALAHRECCGGSSHQSNPDCFDAIYTEELCCAEADWDEEAALSKLGDMRRRKNRGASDEFVAVSGSASDPLHSAEDPNLPGNVKIDALQRYMEDDMLEPEHRLGFLPGKVLLYLFCCNGFHNEYCWGPAMPQALLPDVDAWEGAGASVGIRAVAFRDCGAKTQGVMMVVFPLSRSKQAGSQAMPSLERRQSFQELFRFCDYHIISFAQILPEGGGPARSFTEAEGCPFEGLKDTGRKVSVGRFLPPVKPQDIICIGLNYRAHADELKLPYPKNPVVFMKPTTCAAGHGDAIAKPRVTEKMDYEVELAVVIGRECKDVTPEQALDYVLGYTCANDLSTRDWQKVPELAGSQWCRSKSFEGFAPLGPILVTKDEVPDPGALRVQTFVNGVQMQDSSTRDLIFSVPQIISFLSMGTRHITCLQVWLKVAARNRSIPVLMPRPGDRVAVEVEGLGRFGTATSRSEALQHRENLGPSGDHGVSVTGVKCWSLVKPELVKTALADRMVLAGTSKTVPLWTPPWVGLPPLVQVGGFAFIMLIVAGVTPLFMGQGLFGLKPPVEPEPVEEEKPQIELGVTDDLFAPGRRRRAAPKPAKKAAPAMSEETPEEAAPSEPEPDAEAKPRVSAWQRLKDWMLVHTEPRPAKLPAKLARPAPGAKSPRSLGSLHCAASFKVLAVALPLALGRRQLRTSRACRCPQGRLPKRRETLLAGVGAGVASQSAQALDGAESDYVYPEWFTLPLAPYARRRTLQKEIVPGQVWVLDQIFGTFYVHVPIRATVLKVDGGLLVYAPVAATKECVGMIRALEQEHGPVRWILLPSKAVEHKVLTGPFARRFPDAKLFVAPGQFSVPIDLPLSSLGFPPFEVVDPSRLDELPWAKDCDTAHVDVSTFGEIALFHRSSKTLVVTDSLISIPEDPPPLLLDPEYRKALAYHARDDEGSLVLDADAQRRGWARISLFATFFNPGALAEGEVQVPEASAKRPWRWQPGWQESFRRLRNDGKPLVAPIIRELILKQQPEKTKAYVDRICSWGFVRAVSAHFDCPIKISPKQFRETFSFASGSGAGNLRYCAEDVAFLGDLQQSAIPDGQPVRAEGPCGYKSKPRG
ncbi:unnamed protein product [Symbiodinium pilosum]|uniref:Fumarylacetoacetase-like C-terminal domain-containing protein n=1 Tax=Symbiodinium pilosum TaxID=2952 RepID=A0A812MTJ6_SYMPI|nr:unnamed protein product [Symbiodinium pilosum]